MAYLDGESIQIVACDQEGIATTCVVDRLRYHLESEVTVQLTLVEAADEITNLDPERMNLVLCVPVTSSDIKPVIRALNELEIQKSITRIVYLPSSLTGYTQVLHEAGAQIVVDELLSLNQIIDQIAHKTPRSQFGTHPLTSGLSRRIPWEELDDNTKLS